MYQALSMQGKTVIVTGGAGGIGAKTLELVCARGANGVVVDIDKQRAEELADQLCKKGAKAIAIAVDLEIEDQINAMVETAYNHFGRIDVLNNNAAALSPDMAGKDMDVETMLTWVWDKSFAVNVRGAMIASRAALPHLVATKGNIINTVSNLALQGHIIQAAYSASKAALIQLTKSMAASHGRKGVRVNAVAPGMTMTPALKEAFPAHIRKMVEDETLRDELGSPEDIAQTIAFIASDAARNITGQTIVCDGGLASHAPGFGPFHAMIHEGE
ncbi:MAG: short-chain dehydrogenase [Robiginitomaculum sp.]|nr:MAG: short-chain dehydrogenase [Robiginitomaculum sp.]